MLSYSRIEWRCRDNCSQRRCIKNKLWEAEEGEEGEKVLYKLIRFNKFDISMHFKVLNKEPSYSVFSFFFQVT